MSPHGRRQMSKLFFVINLNCSVLRSFDLLVDILMLVFFDIYLGGVCERIGYSFLPIVCPRLSLYPRLADDGNHFKS